MTGRRLYEIYCDATAAEFSAFRGGWSGADTPLAAWPSLSTAARRRWSAMAKRLGVKR